MIACLAAASLALPLAAPADAHVVYFKDGTAASGAVSVREATVTVKGNGGELSFPLESVRSISFADESASAASAPAPAVWRPDWTVWTMIGLNVAVLAVALVGATRPAAR
jgi:hypothetical protein